MIFRRILSSSCWNKLACRLTIKPEASRLGRMAMCMSGMGDGGGGGEPVRLRSESGNTAGKNARALMSMRHKVHSTTPSLLMIHSWANRRTGMRFGPTDFGIRGVSVLTGRREISGLLMWVRTYGRKSIWSLAGTPGGIEFRMGLQGRRSTTMSPAIAAAALSLPGLMFEYPHSCNPCPNG